ncbi:MAG: isochorismatase family protein [Firmicutes bacterium]|nr:isochorismatase family protein [Bacillota bacterium]
MAKKALILTDVQDDFLGNTLDYIALVCQRYLDEHGSDYELVILTQWKHEDNENEDTLLLEYKTAKVVNKRTHSAYNDEVAALLKDAQIQEVHIGGVDAEISVLATMYRLIDEGYKVQVLERLIGSYHGRNWESMTIARHVVGEENVVALGAQRVWI